MERNDWQWLQPLDRVSEEAGSGGNYDVLVVDGDPEALVVVSLTLEASGYNVVPALNGRTALKIMKAKRFDLLVTDLMMEDMDGIALLKKTKTFYPATKVILMTGFYDPELILEAIQNKADDYLLKPFSLELLEVKAGCCLKNDRNPN